MYSLFLKISYKVSDHHLIFNISDARKSQPQVRPSQIHHHRDAIPAHIDHRKEIEANVSKTEFGYALEAKIPKDFVLNRFDPGMDKSIGLNYILADAKSANHPSDWFAYATPDPHAPPNGWNPVELVGKISGQVALMDEDATHPITAFNAGDTLTLGVWDAERNTDRGQPESIEAKLRNERTGQSLTLILYEADLATLADLYFRRFLGRIENWSQKSYKNTLIDLDRLGLNQSKQIEAGLSDNETRIKPQCGQWHQVPFGISSSPHSQQTC